MKKLHRCLPFQSKSTSSDSAATFPSNKTSKYLTSESSTDSDISVDSSSTRSLDSHASLRTLPSLPSLNYSLSTATAAAAADLRLVSVPLPSLTSPSPNSPSGLHVTSLALQNHSSPILFAATGSKLSLFNTATSSLVASFDAADDFGSVKSIAFLEGGRKVLTAHHDGRIRIWKYSDSDDDCRRWSCKVIAGLPTVEDRVRRFAFSDSYVQVRRHVRRMWIQHNDAVSGIAVHGDLIYSVSWDKTMKVWNARNSRCLESVTAHDDAINAIVVSRDGVVFTGSADKQIRVWTARPGDRNPKKQHHVLIATLDKHRSAVNALTLTPDGSILFSGACDRSILVWERTNGGDYMKVTGALRGHEGAILCLVNLGDLLFSGSADRTVRIWRRGSEGRFCCLSVLQGHRKPVKSLAAKWDGKRDDVVSVYSGGLDGEIKVWRVNILNDSID